MPGLLEEVLSSELFMPHGHCYLWKPGLVGLQVATNALIGLSYLTITLTLITLVRRVRNIPFQTMYLAFGAFIVACGVTHFFDILVIWRPVYWVDGAVRAITAVASVGTALMLPSLLPQVKRLADAAALTQEQGAQLERVNAELQRARDQLEARVAERTADLVRATAELKAEIAERKRVEDTLRAREEDLTTTLDSIGDAVVVTDAESRVVSMNPVAERLTGYTRAESQGRPLGDIFRVENEDTGLPVENPVLRVLREGVVVGLANHTNLITRDGRRIPIADSGAPVRRDKGEVRGVILVFRDVTAERQGEEALRHWERVFQHATWGVALASASDVRFQAVNPAYARMHGYTVEELLGAPVSTLWAPETKGDMERHAHDTHHHGHLVAETVHLCKDGTRLPVEVVATTIKNARGEIAWFVANVQDITERKRLQQTRDRTVQLESENRRIEEANRLKSEFLANMSHELRTPLNSIIGFAELLHDEAVDPVTAKQKEFLGDILTGGRHLLRLINDVLDLAKVEAGKMEFHPEPLDLADVVGQLVQSLRTTADAKGLRVDVSVEPSLTDVVLDPGRFKQVLYNYLSNALKFTPEGGRVMVRLLPEGDDRLLLEVEDTGVGISAENMQRLFVAFHQLESGATKRHAGTGLGLALTKRLAEAQGGVVGVRRAPERGSVFFAVLPRRPGQIESAGHRVDKPATAAVLVVEDDPRDQAVLTRILTEAGYQVDAVATCVEAVAALRTRSYDAVTLDLLLPDGASLPALLQLIRSDSRRPNVPVIAVTMVAEQGVAAGFPVDDILERPIDPTALLAALERAGVPRTRDRPVLVVDDDVGSLRLMEATLARLGYDALCFSNATAALRALAQVHPIAIVLDMVMPDLDGLAFLDRFRASPENKAVPVMIWTVKDLSAEERRDLHAAADAIVQKGVGEAARLSVALQAFLPARPASSAKGAS